MKGGRNIGLLVIGAIVVILLLWGCGGYNGLVSSDQNVKKCGVMWKLITSAERIFIAA